MQAGHGKLQICMYMYVRENVSLKCIKQLKSVSLCYRMKTKTKTKTEMIFNIKIWEYVIL